MNKEQLIAATARRMKNSQGEENRYSKWEIALIVPHILDAISESLSNGEEVQLQGFGRFDVKEVKARNCINPSTKERMVVPARKKVVFHPTPRFKFASEPTDEENTDTTTGKE